VDAHSKDANKPLVLVNMLKEVQPNLTAENLERLLEPEE
jgi:hypothetical protein